MPSYEYRVWIEDSNGQAIHLLQTDDGNVAIHLYLTIQHSRKYLQTRTNYSNEWKTLTLAD